MGSFNDNLKQVKTKTGTGIFTTVDIPKDTIIFEFKGEIVKDKDLPKDADMNYYLQIGKDTHLGPSGGVDDFFNHSCNPNAGVMIIGHRALLIAIQLIKANTEITFDYSTTDTSTSEEWAMKCKCGDYNCRKTISGYSSLDTDTQKKYEAMKIVPKYLKE